MLSVAAATASATIAFVIGRRLGREQVERIAGGGWRNGFAAVLASARRRRREKARARR